MAFKAAKISYSYGKMVGIKNAKQVKFKHQNINEIQPMSGCKSYLLS